VIGGAAGSRCFACVGPLTGWNRRQWTATVEAALMDTPFVMVYRVSPLTYFLGKSRVKVPHFAMVNLIAGERIVPELVQHDFTAANITAQLGEILPMGRERDRHVAQHAGGFRLTAP